jgi:hypothetical protein
MTVPDISHLEPWLENLRSSGHKDWFRRVFSKIILFKYKPCDLGENDIQDGHDLLWQKRDTYITASGSIQFNHSGDLPGITLEDESNSYEMQISVNSPLEVVFSAIKYLNPDEE